MGIKIGNTDIDKICIYSPTRLPNTYQEVEYIQTSGTQYIDTTYNPTGDSTAEIKYEMLSHTNGQETWIFAIWVNGCQWRCGYNGSNVGDTSYGFSYSPSLALNTIVTSNGSISASASYSVYLFAQNESGTAHHLRDSMRLYYCKIWSNGVLQREFIPCYRKSDSVIGLYDLVNNTFYTNSGSGTFTKGSNIDIPGYKDISKVYLGSTQIRPPVAPRTPGANTVAYYEFNNNLNDSSGNGYNMSLRTGTVAYNTTSGGAKYAHFNNSTYTNYANIPIDATKSYTISFWYNPQHDYGSDRRRPIFELWRSSSYVFLTVYSTLYSFSDTGFTSTKILSPTINQWYYITIVRTPTAITYYVNNTVVASGTITNTNGGTARLKFNQVGDTNSSNYANNIYISEFIIENKEWSGQEVGDYFKATKSNYGVN